jgi:hypothetical protein
MILSLKRNLTYFAAVLSLSSATSLAAITWSSAVTIAGDADVYTADSSAYYAYRFDTTAGVTSDLTINGVTFTAINGSGTTTAPYSHANFVFAPVTSGTMQSSNHQFATGRSGGVSTSATLSADYKTLLGALIFAGGANATDVTGRQNAFELTLKGLEVGKTYSIQLWFNDSREGTSSRRGTIDGGGAVDYNTTNGAGGLGQHVTGTFTATGVQESFIFRGAANDGVGAQLNAFQLRIVPEPSSVLLGCMGPAALVFRRRR